MSSPSPEALAANQQVALLAQRLEALENRDGIQDKRIETLQAAANMLEGGEKARSAAANSTSKWIGPVVSGLLFVFSLGVGGGIYGKLNTLNDQIVDLTVAAADREARVRSIADRKAPDLGPINSDLAKFETRIATIEANLTVRDANNLRRDTQLAELTKSSATNESEIQANRERITANSKVIDDLKAQATINLRNIAAIDSKTSAGFVEVESQMRGIQAMFVTKLDSTEVLLGAMWQKIFGQSLPDSKSLPLNIPAQATTQIGGSAAQ